MESYAITEFCKCAEKNEFGEELQIFGSCSHCAQAIWQTVRCAADGKKTIPKYSDTPILAIPGSGTKILLACWCPVLHRHMEDALFWCDSNPPEQQDLDDFLENDAEIISDPPDISEDSI